MQTIKRLTPAIGPSVIRRSPWGELPLPFAPQIRLNQNDPIVPQQYLQVERNVSNVEAILQEIGFRDDYILFAGEENGVISLQVGIIGCENYPYNAQQAVENKIVYGRRWLIEPTTPTSEVVQTAMLAIKKAREHELRENVFILLEEQIKTTPFNTHMDLPLMKSNPGFFEPEPSTGHQDLAQKVRDGVNSVLNDFKLKSFEIQLDSIIPITNDKSLVELVIKPSEEGVHFPEFIDCGVSIVCRDFNESEFMYELMNELIKISERYVEEQLTFDGFARFSQKVCPKRVAEFSYQTRNLQNIDPRFHQHFRQMSYDVDSSKAPTFSSGILGEKQRQIIEKNNVSAGYLPNEPDSAHPLQSDTA